jgi:hypothetical protein
MPKYIDQEALLKDIEDSVVFTAKSGQPSLEIRGANKITARIMAAPAADVVEVRHGKWRGELVERCDWRGKKQKYYQPNSCSLCHEAVLERTNYCPNCGAKMDGKGE